MLRTMLLQMCYVSELVISVRVFVRDAHNFGQNQSETND